MKPKLFVILALLVLLPLGALGWLGWRTAWQEQEVVDSRFRETLMDRLRDVHAMAARVVEAQETELLRVVYAGKYETGALREIVRRTPAARAIFVLDGEGRRWHPPMKGPLTDGERAFLERADQIWRDKGLFYTSGEAADGTRAQGWYTWYWGNGANLLFWLRNPSGRVIGVDVDRSWLLGQVIAQLPDSNPSDPNGRRARIALVGRDGTVAYQWGLHAPAPGEAPRAHLALDPPLDAWTLNYYAPAPQSGAARRSVLFNLAAGLSALALAVAGLAVYFYRESTREMREASVRVSFVNRVSHELKTPLTNIRMYAELLRERLNDADPDAARHLGVIVSESQRLSRLITNVLAVAPKEQGGPRPQTSVGVVDTCVDIVIGQFAAAFAARGVQVAFNRGAERPVQLDRDALVQILGNLFSNVEKYAAGGGTLEVTTSQADSVTTVAVADRGPGIPAGQEDRIFEPFVRLSNRLTDVATGTGIGLTIARDLARQHGGDLRVTSSASGARFELTLHTPPIAAAAAIPLQERRA